MDLVRMPPKRTTPSSEPFGARLRRLRKAKGFTQVELARAIGTSQPMIAQYEAGSGLPGPLILLTLAEVLETSPEAMLGVEKNAKSRKPVPDSPENLRLWRKLRLVEKLSPPERRQVTQLIDALVERNTLKREKAS